MRFFVHRMLCLWYQMQQQKALDEMSYADRLRKAAKRDLDTASTRELEEKLAFEQWRRIVGAR